MHRCLRHVLPTIIFMLSAAPAVVTAQPDQNTKAAIQKIADAIQNNDTLTADKLIAKLSKDDEDFLYSAKRTLRSRAGKEYAFGVGKQPGQIKPDGIEQMIHQLAEKGPAPGLLQNNGADLTEMAYRVAAVAAITKAYRVEKKSAQKRWDTLATEMNELALDFAKSVQGGQANAIQKSAAKLTANCTRCHSEFREFPYGKLYYIGVAIRNGDKATAEDIVESFSGYSSPTAILKSSMKTLRPDGKSPAFGLGKPLVTKQAEGIEAKLLALTRLEDNEFNENRRALEDMAYLIAAVAWVTQVLVPQPPPKNWQKHGQDMYDRALDLATAAPKQPPAVIRAAAINLGKTCINCHRQAHAWPAAELHQIATALKEQDKSAADVRLQALLDWNFDDSLFVDAMHTLKGRPGMAKDPVLAPIAVESTERKLHLLARRPEDVLMLVPQKNALVEMGYRMHTVSLIAKQVKKKDQLRWDAYALGMYDCSLAFAKAAKTMKPSAVHKAAIQLEAQCTICHARFR